MDKLEKVIRGLGCLAGENEMQSNPCNGCGYQECQTYAICVEEIVRDALSLLKAQKPRVMTLEEVFERSKHMDEDAVWIEFEDEDGDMVVYPAILSNSKPVFEAEYSIVAALRWEKKYFPLGTYGKKWRCWTSKPSDEQRNAENLEKAIR